MDNIARRSVRCRSCGWLVSLPATLELEVAVELAHGLCRLHLQHSHGGQTSRGAPLSFDFVNLREPERLRLTDGTTPGTAG